MSEFVAKSVLVIRLAENIFLSPDPKTAPQHSSNVMFATNMKEACLSRISKQLRQQLCWSRNCFSFVESNIYYNLYINLLLSLMRFTFPNLFLRRFLIISLTYMPMYFNRPWSTFRL
jgi:hypothetical protein